MIEAKNLPLFLGVSEQGDETIATLLKGELSLEQSLVRLSQDFKIRIRFSEPITVQIHKHWVVTEKTDEFTRRAQIRSKTSDVLVFPRFFMGSTYGLCYATSRGARHGYPFSWLDKIVSYEPVNDVKQKEFKNFEQFKKKFDPLFITDAEVQRLWNQKSSQHGGRYQPADFHKIGPRGLQTLKRFMVHFKSVSSSETGPGYLANSTLEEGKPPRYYLTEHYHSYSHTGRDIQVSHLAGNDFVWYSSEYHGCGNGRYGLIANKREFLHLEDD